jgi:hypothetical protein
VSYPNVLSEVPLSYLGWLESVIFFNIGVHVACLVSLFYNRYDCLELCPLSDFGCNLLRYWYTSGCLVSLFYNRYGCLFISLFKSRGYLSSPAFPLEGNWLHVYSDAFLWRGSFIDRKRSLKLCLAIYVYSSLSHTVQTIFKFYSKWLFHFIHSTRCIIKLN